MFVRIPQVLSAEQLGAIRAALNHETAAWIDGRATAGHQGVKVKNNRQLEEQSAVARDLGALIVAQLQSNPVFVSAVLPNRIYPPIFNRYGPGMNFGNHVDGAIRQMPGTGQTLRTDLSATLFLTPPESYDGGELVVDSDFGSQQAKLAATDLIIYSSALRHRVNPVTRGQRLAVVFWIQSLIRDDVKRAQLFELDQTIRHLSQSNADQESLLRLTGHYHTLLRLWTDI